MKMSARSGRIALCFCMLLIPGLGARAVYAIPDVITISGVLEDIHGIGLDSPPEGFLARIEFFGGPTSTEVIDSATTRTVVTDGVFAIRHRPSDSLLALDAVFYSLAIDTGGNGLDHTDEFPDRFEITSAPFALSGPPVDFFVTDGGLNAGISTLSRPSSGFTFSDMSVYPFISPPGGVVFDTMSVYMRDSQEGAQVSFGIYDQDGKRVVTTGKFAPGLIESTLKEISVSGRLRPTRVYYAAWARDVAGVTYHRANVPAVRNAGIVPGVVTNGEIPPSFDPENIVFSVRVGLSISLSR